MKRFLSMLLVLVMVFSMIPQAAFAAEEGTFVESTTVLQVGDNAITLDTSVEATAFHFQPSETGTYKFTGPEGSIVGISGYNWVSYLPDSDTNSCEWPCTAVGQSVYIGVSGIEAGILNVSKTAEHVSTETQYTVYVNTHTPEAFYADACTSYGDWNSVPSVQPGVQPDEMYYGVTADEMYLPVYVDFNYSKLSINGMLSSGAAKYVEKNDNGEITLAIDYTQALSEYAAFGKYPLTGELATMLQRLDAYKGWTAYGWIDGWQELCFISNYHVEGEGVTSGDKINVSCTECDKLLYTMDVPGYSAETPIEVSFDENGIATVTVEPGTWYYGFYGMGNFSVTANGEPVDVTPGMGFFVPNTFVLVNEGTEAIEVELARIVPVGTMDNPKSWSWATMLLSSKKAPMVTSTPGPLKRMAFCPSLWKARTGSIPSTT